MEVMLLLMVSIGDFHIITIDLCQVVVIILYPHDSFALKDIGCVLTLYLFRHDTSDAISIITHERGLLIIILGEQLSDFSLYRLHGGHFPREKGYP